MQRSFHSIKNLKFIRKFREMDKKDQFKIEFPEFTEKLRQVEPAVRMPGSDLNMLMADSHCLKRQREVYPDCCTHELLSQYRGFGGNL